MDVFFSKQFVINNIINVVGFWHLSTLHLKQSKFLINLIISFFGQKNRLFLSIYVIYGANYVQKVYILLKAVGLFANQFKALV